MKALSSLYRYASSLEPQEAFDDRNSALHQSKSPEIDHWKYLTELSKLYLTGISAALRIEEQLIQGESSYALNGIVDEVLSELKKKSLLQSRRKKLGITFKKNFKVLQRENGTFTYALFDLAALYTRRKARWIKNDEFDCQHFSFGHYLDSRKQKLKSRTMQGSFLMSDVLDHVGIETIRWNEFSRNSNKSFSFSYDKFTRKNFTHTQVRFNSNIVLFEFKKVLSIAVKNSQPSLLIKFYASLGSDTNVTIQFIKRTIEYLLKLK
eukprot:snap_masked-scaffold_10-processed-gene-4.26-mRNA-1 protein AED:1.00 eAED:1.00 QI:0/0/0/0/1/1/2/0/264